ncbi:AzlD domain-containing protein [Pseudomonas sp. Marseille-QA0892]
MDTTWLMIIGMLVITFSIRYSFFAWPSLRFSPAIRQALHYVPIAVLTAIVVPAMLMPGGNDLDVSFDNAYLLGGIATIILAAATRHLLVTIAGGLVIFFLLRWALGQLGV